MMLKLIKRLERVSLSQRLLLASFLLVTVLAGLATALSTARSSRALSDGLREGRGLLARFTANRISERFQEAMRVANLTLQQKVVYDAFERTASTSTYPLALQLSDAKEMEDFVYRLQPSHQLVRVRLLFCGDAIYTNQSVNFFRMSEEDRQRLSALRSQGVFFEFTAQKYPYIFQNAQRVVSVVTTMYGETYFDVIGGVSIDLALGDIESLLSRMLIDPSDAVVLLDASDNVVTRVGGEDLAVRDLPVLGDDAWGEADDGRTLYYQTRLETSGWRISYRMDGSALFQPVSRLRSQISMIFLLVLALALILSGLMSRLNTRRIRQLSAAMDQVRGGDMDIRIREGGGRELNNLERSFNFLLESMRTLIANKLEDQMALKNMQIRLLQSQIQPHFLYNTLDLIGWRLLTREDPEGARLVQALAQFYKIGLSRGEEMIPLQGELTHVQRYVEIQNFRLDGRIELAIRVDEGCFDLLVPGNLLQPLVENAISHGILEKDSGQGRIVITAARAGDTLTLVVSDDGVGADVQALTALLEQKDAAHYGAWNIHNRLRLLFGEGFGLRYARNNQGGIDAVVALRATDPPRAKDSGMGDQRPAPLE